MMAPAPAPMPEAGVMPAAPVVAPRAADDMTGSVGVGVGIADGTSLIIPDTTNLMMKYWMSDGLALVPRLSLGISKAKGADAAWMLAPSVLAQFTLLKGASTRLLAGIGLGFAIGKDPAATTALVPGGEVGKTAIDIFIPMQVGVEHFFTRWFAMGISADFNFLNFGKQGTPWVLDVQLNNTAYMGSLFFYTD
jgi:hypothetical protein